LALPARAEERQTYPRTNFEVVQILSEGSSPRHASPVSLKRCVPNQGAEMKSRVTAAVLVMGCALSLAACAEDEGGSGGDGGDDSGPIKIGAVLDLTGAGASLGGPQRTTLEMLAEEISAAGGIDGREVELIIEDNQSLEDGAAQAANKLVSEDQVDVILGSSRTGPSLAMRPVAASAGVPMISLAANAAIVEGDGSECVYKTTQNDVVVIDKMVAFASEQGWTTMSMAKDASGFGEGVDGFLEEVGSEQGVEVATVEEFAPDATDFTAQMVNLRSAGADANIIWGIPPASGVAQKAYVQLGLDVPVLHSHGSASSAFLEAAGNDAEGAYVTVGRIVVADQLPADDPQADVIKEFVSAYQEASGGESPSPFAGYAYDAWNLAVDAITEAGTDSQAICDHLEQVSDFVGVSGVFTMTPENHSGLDTDALVLAQVKDGKFTLVPESE
jgi:branched-chain amino acid transport system substrate-binding protein